MCIELAWLEKIFHIFIASTTPFLTYKDLSNNVDCDDNSLNALSLHFNYLLDNDLITHCSQHYDDDETQNTTLHYRITAEGLKMASALLNRSVFDNVQNDLKKIPNTDLSFSQVQYLCDKHSYNLTVGKNF